jgi:uncharacterized protein YbaA (DUF1428 family)
MKKSLLALAFLAVAACDKPGISSAHMSSKADGSDSVSSFSASTPSLYFRIEYSLLSEGDSIVVKLMYGDQELTEVANTIPSDGDGMMNGGFTAHSTWPTGTYELRILVNGALEKTVPFSID